MSPTLPDPDLGIPVPLLAPGQPPLALLVDYDGTIATVDVADRIQREFGGPTYVAAEAAYAAGALGSRARFEEDAARLPADPTWVVSMAASQPHDRTFSGLAGRALRLGVAIEVVSDGFGFYIEPALRRLGVQSIPIVTSRTIFDGGKPRMEFPNGHPECFVCGTCKRQRVLAHQAAGRRVVFVGDGESDRYAAAYADFVFAKKNLSVYCKSVGLPFTPWEQFTEIEAWLVGTIDAWRSDPRSLPAPAHRPFICGPEVWGPGRTNPPPGARKPGPGRT